MQVKKTIRSLIPKPLRALARKAANAVLPTETIDQSKRKWNMLAEKNARYFVMTDYGKDISEEQFRASGKKDFDELVARDSLLKDRLSPFNEKTVLEIGCGAGRITEFFADAFKEVTGLDISEKMIAEGKARLKNKKNVSLVAGDGRYLPLPDESFDFIFSFIVFQHMPDRETIVTNLKEISRVLKRKGVAKIQLRGLPTSKRNWFYGPSFNESDLPSVLKNINLSVMKTGGTGTRYFWLWLKRTL